MSKTTAIKGHKKGSQDIAYFLSHGDTVILGSGNSKKTLTTKISELDTALGHKVEWVDVYNYLETGAKMPVTNGYLFKGEPVNYFVIKGSAIVFRVWNATNSRFEYIGYTRTNDYPETWAFQSILQWSELTDNFKKAIDEGLVKAEEALSRLDAIDEAMPATASSSNKLATASDVSAVATTANSALGKASTTEQLLPSDVNPETNKLTTEKKRAKVVVRATQHGVTTTSELGKLVQIVASTLGGNNLSKVFEVNEITGDNPGIEIVLPYLITNSMISDGAVTTAKILDGNVTKAKLAQEVLDFLEEYLADFKGTVETTAALKALTGDKNDWAVYKHNDANNNVIYSRYRYDASYNDNTTGHWRFELDVNSSSFTAAQWAAINSGVTSSKVGGYDSHIGNDVIHVTYDDKTAWNNKKESFAIPTPDPYVSNPYLPEGWRNKIPMLGDMIVQERVVFVDGNQYVVFVGGSEPHYMIFTYEYNSDAFDMFVTGGTVSGVNGSEQYANVLFAAYPEFASCADLGGYEFDEVDVDTLLS